MKYRWIAVVGRSLFVVVCGVSAVAGQHHLYSFRDSRSNSWFGAGVSGVGDVDNDGHDDVLVGAPGVRRFRGEAQVRSGRSGRVLYRYTGDSANDSFGATVAGLGDVDKDGRPDFAVGAPGGLSTRGYVRVFSGRTGKKLLELRGPVLGDEIGYGLAYAGDLNKDGHNDVFVGAHGAKNSYTRVYSGKDGRVLLHLPGPPRGSHGRVIASAGDTNRDGVTDFVAGMGAWPSPTPGYAIVYSGRTGKVLHTLRGSGWADALGHSVSTAGDANGDGYDDILVGAGAAQYARVYSGKTGKALLTVTGSPLGRLFGSSVGALPDINGDAIPDFFVGTPCEPFFFQCGPGAVRVYSGKDGKELMRFTGDRNRDDYGRVVSYAGDLNRDGKPDLIVGAPAGQYARALSTVALGLTTDIHELSLSVGGRQRLHLLAPASNAGQVYVFLGTASGTRPGFSIGQVRFWLNLDSYSLMTLIHPNITIMPSVGMLDAKGKATASFILPSGLSQQLAGITLHHLAMTLGPKGIGWASNPTPITLAK